jgi:hypothetical protein
MKQFPFLSFFISYYSLKMKDAITQKKKDKIFPPVLAEKQLNISMKKERKRERESIKMLLYVKALSSIEAKK